MAKPQFDPSKPFQTAQVSGGDKPAFDPSKPFDSGETPQEEKNNPVVSGVRSALQGATGGFSDEFAGAVEGAGRVAGVKGLGGQIKDISLAEDGPTLDWEVIKHAYKRARDKEREDLKKDKKDNPGISTAADIAGAIVSPVNKIAKGASLVKGGAMIGGVTGAGMSDAENIEGVAGDAALGAGVGLGAGKVLEKASPYIQKGVDKVAGKSKEFAERFAARALGAERGTIKKLGQNKVQEAGRQALDEKVITARGSTDDKIARNTAAKAKGAGKMNEVYDAIDEAGASKFNPLETASKVDEEIGGFYRSPINQGETRQLENTLESILQRGDKNIPLKEAQILKQEIGKVANWKNNLNITEKEKMAREAYKIVSQNIDDAAQSGAKSINREGLEETLKVGKKLYGNAKTSEVLLENKLAREQGNNFMGLTDVITGGSAIGYGGVTGDWDTAVGIVAAKKGLQKYGAQNAALAMDKLSKSLMKSPKIAELAQKSPAAFQAIVSKLEKRIPLPRAAEEDAPPVRLKGKEKWAMSGYSNLLEHDKSGSLQNEKLVEKLFSDSKGKDLLISASDLKPGSKAMGRLFEKIENQYGKAK